VSGPSSPEDPPAPGRLDDRVLAALHEMHGRMAFSGLRRNLGAHPESLARSLRRLEREGLIDRADDGYRALGPPAALAPFSETDLHPIARVDVPLGVSADAILSRLSGRWFGGLRWLGHVERGSQRLLSWSRRDGTGTVLLGVQRGSLRIFVTSDRSPDEPGDSEDAAYELLVALAEVLRPGPARSVAFLAAETRPFGTPTGAAFPGDN
jgi:hypothetical protein